VDARAAISVVGEQFEDLIEALPDLTLVLDPASARIEYANHALEALGWVVDGPAPIDAETVLPGIRDAIGDARDVAMLEVVDINGERTSVEVVMRHVVLPSGRQRILVSARDINERIESEVRLLRLATAERTHTQTLYAVIGSMAEGVALIAADGRILVANDALADIAGHPVATHADLPTFLREADSGLVRLHDPERWLQVSLIPLEAEGADAKLLIVRDVTQEAEAAAARDAFLGVLSHELRTPVTTILGTANLLTRERVEPDLARDRGMAADIQAEAERLNFLIEDLLVLSRAQAGALELEPEPVLLQHLIREVVAAERDRYPHLVYEIGTLEGLAPVIGDRTSIAQVLRNLIGNAGKYSPDSGGTITIDVSVGGGEVTVRILDTGPGFDASDTDRLFDIFYRASRTAKLRAGSGIGLYVTRRLVEAMGGRVWAARRDPVGSEFGFTLPVAPVDESDMLVAHTGVPGSQEDGRADPPH